MGVRPCDSNVRDERTEWDVGIVTCGVKVRYEGFDGLVAMAVASKFMPNVSKGFVFGVQRTLKGPT